MYFYETLKRPLQVMQITLAEEIILVLQDIFFAIIPNIVEGDYMGLKGLNSVLMLIST